MYVRERERKRKRGGGLVGWCGTRENEEIANGTERVSYLMLVLLCFLHRFCRYKFVKHYMELISDTHTHKTYFFVCVCSV